MLGRDVTMRMCWNVVWPPVSARILRIGWFRFGSFHFCLLVSPEGDRTTPYFRVYFFQSPILRTGTVDMKQGRWDDLASSKAIEPVIKRRQTSQAVRVMVITCIEDFLPRSWLSNMEQESVYQCPALGTEFTAEPGIGDNCGLLSIVSSSISTSNTNASYCYALIPPSRHSASP